jgi:hypothetical protein
VETWKDIPGYEGRYQVSDEGRVRSLDRPVRVVCHGVEAVRIAKGKLLQPGRNGSGHVTVALGKGNSRQVHQLVLEAFVGPCPAGCEVLHLNHQHADNRLENLRYGTRSENLRMDYQAGRRTVPQNFIGARWRA